MRFPQVPVSVLVPVLFALAGCASPAGDERLARQAALGATIEHQALRFADQLLYDAIDCAGTPDDNAAAIEATVSGNLGTCAEITRAGAELDVVTGASCSFGEHVYASLSTNVAVSREGSDLVLALTLSRARINGLDTEGTVTLRSADCRTFRAAMDLTSTEYTLATRAGEELVVESEATRTTVTGSIDVVALNASMAERFLTVDNDGMVFGTGQCWPEAGAIHGSRSPALVTIAFDATTPVAGNAQVSPGIDGTSLYALPMYGPCPDTDPRP